MTGLERKLNALNKCRKGLNPAADRTARIRSCVQKIDVAFSDYIRSDNVDHEGVVKEPLNLIIESHPDFQTAVTHIDRAIRSTEAAIEAEEQARREAEERKRMQEA